MAYESSILVLFAHPALEKSRLNRRMVDAIRDVDGITFHDLYEIYPDFFIDVPAEQRRLVRHDVVVFQHPFYWYSTPAMVKQWEDLVLEHGWAYGSQGDALRGKRWLTAITAGGSEAEYHPEGLNRYTIPHLLAPLEQTARLCGMDFLPPFIGYGTHAMSADDMTRHARDYRRTLIALRDGALDLRAARRYPHLNADLDALIPRGVGTG